MTESHTSTGTVCEHSGQYIADCDCRETVTLGSGDVFPTCTACEGDVFWMLFFGD